MPQRKRNQKKIFSRAEKIGLALAVVVVAAGAVKASDYYLNKDGAEQGNDGCPAEMVFVSTAGGGFCIDRFENSAGNNCPAANPASGGDTANNLNEVDCRPVSEFGRIPWRNITQNQAIAACARAGKRLPTGEEWYQAALGTPDPAEGWLQADCQVANNWEAQPGLTGSGKNCRSGAGAYDMVGNVWEWVREEIVDGSSQDKKLPGEGYVSQVDLAGDVIETDSAGGAAEYNQDYFWIKDKGTRGMARGGYWDNKSGAGQYSVYLTLPPDTPGAGVGFRCVK